MSDIKIFDNKEFGQVRTLQKNGDIWFVAKDVCDALNLSNVTRSIDRLDKDEKGLHSVNTPGGFQHLNTINEPGLYSLILTSRKPEAKEFKRWITHEVIPSIRKTGSYSVSQPNSIEDLIIMQAQSMKQIREEVAVTSEKVNKIENSFAQIDEDWRIYANDVFRRIGNETGDFSSYRKESYIQLERRARCNLKTRLENKRNRMEVAGVCKSNINKVNYLDVIEEDSKLVEIYVAIVKEFEVRYL